MVTAARCRAEPALQRLRTLVAGGRTHADFPKWPLGPATALSQMAAIRGTADPGCPRRPNFDPHDPRKWVKFQSAQTVVHRVDVAGTLIEVGFTPNRKIEARLAHLIATAGKSIHFMMFLFANEALGEAIVTCHARGIPVQGILERKMSRVGRFSQLARLQKAGVALRFDDNAFFLHHKTIVIDESVVITGSMNFTRNALEVNDENVVIVHDDILAKVYLEEFNRNWSASLPADR